MATAALVSWLGLMMSATPSAEQLVCEVSWQQLTEAGKLLGGELASADTENGDSLLIRNTSDSPLTLRLWETASPGITATRYAVSGQIRYEDVQGAGYLESWQTFADKGRYFTRTLAASGPMGKIEGTSNWREFMLPFQSSPEAGSPTKLELSIVLPGSGTVVLSPLRVTQATQGTVAAAGTIPWWSARMSGWVGAILGVGLGVLGAIIGLMASCTRTARFAPWSLAVMCGLGFVSTIAGLVAVILGQPYHVFYPLILSGLICMGVGGPLWFVQRQRVASLELRKMSAMDVS